MNSRSAPPSREPRRIQQEDTIVAIATPAGESGIGVVRISGLLAESIAGRIFKSKQNPPAFRSHHFNYGKIVDPETGKTVDEVMLVLMKSPLTYTREDIVEIQCHGGYLLPRRILELVLKQGARIAEPGEFTKRAFLNGRLDLTQAEAVIDLIKARTEKSRDLAQQQLSGTLLTAVSEVKRSLLRQLAFIEAQIDFPDEDIDTIPVEQIKNDLSEMEGKLESWISSFEEGRAFREGVGCAIVGRTNVGKSSLLNALVKEDRAIVTAVPGTTRDVIEEVLDLYGVPVRMIDTAGLRKPEDPVEQEGVRRTRERLAVADIVLFVIDGSEGFSQKDKEILEEIKEKKKVVVINKSDVAQKVKKIEIEAVCSDCPIVAISALKCDGIEDLKRIIYGSVVKGEFRSAADYLVVANVRHKAALARMRESVSGARKGLMDEIPLELVAVEMRSALDAAGDLVGETTSEEVLNLIFDQFCIGK